MRVWSNPHVMKQLEQSEAEAESDYIANYDDYNAVIQLKGDK